MKPPPFEYVRAESLDHALEVLAEHGDEAKPVAGGQSLVPLLNLRLARPEVLVDVNRLPLDRIETVDGSLRTGGLVRHRTLCLDPAVQEANPLLRRAAGYIGHTAIRNRGTTGGSIAHADPAAELSLVAVVCDATIGVRSAEWQREVPARGFFHGPFMTDLAPEELIVGVDWPALGPADRWGFSEIAERAGDFADAAAAVLIRERGADVAVAGVPGSPLLLEDVGRWLSDGESGEDGLRAVVRESLAGLGSDAVPAPIARLVEQMVVDAVGQATADARSAARSAQ